MSKIFSNSIFNSKRAKFFVCILILLFSEIFFFRNIIFSEALVGSRGDGRFTMLVTEHWFKFFSGKVSFGDLGFFWPEKNIIGFSDMFLGYGLLHSIFRALGIDVFLSYKITLMLVHLIGTFSVFWFLLNILSADAIWSLFGTIAFSFSCTYAQQLFHTQLMTISLVPCMTICIFRFFQNINSEKKIYYAIVGIFLFELILYTAWYIAFFVILFTATFSIVYLILKWNEIEEIWKFLRQHFLEFSLYFLLTVILSVPFLIIELPIAKSYNGWNYGTIFTLLPDIISFINVSSENWLLGNFFSALSLSPVYRTVDNMVYGNFEYETGFSIVLLIMWISVWYKIKKHEPLEMNVYFRAVAISIVIGFCLLLRLSRSGLSLWMLVYAIFPGASAVRLVSRYMFFLSLPMAICTAWGANRLMEHSSKNSKHIFSSCILLILLFISNIRNNGVHSLWNRKDEVKFLDSVPAPPSDCKVFYITDKKQKEKQIDFYYQLDAYAIADKFNIKTINGCSGIYPIGWKGILFVATGENYQNDIEKWIYEKKLKNVYSYDKSDRCWIRQKA